ncbi:Zn-ribbon domain-containing OB-fold protein [Achromobacter aloeverae]
MSPSDPQQAGHAGDPYALAYPETRPFWEAAERGELLVKACRACGKAHWYPRVVCPLCGSGDTEWKPASGRGALYSYSVVERADPPYVLAYVRLEEGPVMISNLVDADPAAIRIGMPLRARFLAAPQGRRMPFFAPDTPGP